MKRITNAIQFTYFILRVGWATYLDARNDTAPDGRKEGMYHV